jgi:hypothetical protein
LPAIAHVFTIGCVAEMLGEDADRLQELSIGMFPEHACLSIYNGKDDAVTTDQGIERPKPIITGARAASSASTSSIK